LTARSGAALLEMAMAFGYRDIPDRSGQVFGRGDTQTLSLVTKTAMSNS
jgi:hypothetical protein